MAPLATLDDSRSSPVPDKLVTEIAAFRDLCWMRYRFNSRCDNLLNIAGIFVSVAIVVAGIFNRGVIAAVLGGVVTALVSANRAFPFNQRWQFYRILHSQTENLLTDATNQLVTLDHAAAALKSMRLDFAQQIPRGSGFRSEENVSEAGTSASGSAPLTGKQG